MGCQSPPNGVEQCFQSAGARILTTRVSEGPEFYGMMKMINKNALKYTVDAILFIDICAIAVIGVLLAFVIPQGRGDRASKYFLGLHRHDWGDIHLYLSLLLLVLIAWHLWNNRTWIKQSTKRYFGGNWKGVLWSFAGAWVLVLAIVWMAA